MSGKAPLPLAILRARGSWRGRRKGIEPEAKRPACPAWLNPVAKKCWREIVPQLDAIGILTRLDRNALARYCIVYSKWRKAEEWLDKAGLVQVVSGGKDETKTMKEWAQSAMSDRYHDQLSKLEIQFGLTPSARARFAANGLTRRDGETRGRKAQTEDDKFFAYGS